MMAKDKPLVSLDIINYFMDYVLDHNSQPKNVYKFAQDYNFEERLFYNFFGSFEALEKQLFNEFHNQTLSLVTKSDDYQHYDTRNKLLTYYFTFFEILNANRTYVVYALSKEKNNLKTIHTLRVLRKSFQKYIKDLEIETIDLKQEKLEHLKDKSIQESAWIQLLITLKFWLDDSSPSFEKTDIFIEKSVKASFDLIENTPIKSLIDLGKFLLKEKTQAN